MRNTTKTTEKNGNLNGLAGLFGLLSDKTRVNLLMLLADGERNVNSLCEAMGMPQPTISHHLGLLRMCDLLSNRRQGKQVFYSLADQVTAGRDGSLEITCDYHVVTISK